MQTILTVLVLLLASTAAPVSAADLDNASLDAYRAWARAHRTRATPIATDTLASTAPLRRAAVPAPPAPKPDAPAAPRAPETDAAQCRGVGAQTGTAASGLARSMQDIHPYVRPALRRLLPHGWTLAGDAPPARRVAWDRGQTWINALDQVASRANFCIDLDHTARIATIKRRPLRLAGEASAARRRT